MNDRGNLIKLLLFLFIVPGLGWLTGLGIESSHEASFYKAIVVKNKMISAEEYKMRGLSYLAYCNDIANRNVDNEKICYGADEIRLVKLCSLGTAGLGVILFGLIFGGKAYAGRNRKRMSMVFEPLVRIVMLVLAISVLAQGALFVYSVYTIEAVVGGKGHAILLFGVGIGTLWACWVLIDYSLCFFKTSPIVLRGLKLDRGEQKHLFDFVASIADKLRAQFPENIVVGLEPNFFVTSSDILLVGGKEKMCGRTLFVSLSLLRCFTKEELSAVIGHELGHFRGDDVDYSVKFAPFYMRLGKALADLAQSTGSGAMDLGRIPAVFTLMTCYGEFAGAERTVGRERELLADQAGTEAASNESLAHALVKVSIFGPCWSAIQQENKKIIEKEGRFFSNLATAHSSFCSQCFPGEDWRGLLESLGQFVQPHPIDTHPPMALRLQGLGVNLSEMAPEELSVPEHSASELVAGVEKLEAELSNLEVQWLMATGEVVLFDSSIVEEEIKQYQVPDSSENSYVCNSCNFVIQKDKFEDSNLFCPECGSPLNET